MPQGVSLCPACSRCPTVEIDGRAVRIGDGANRVILSPAEWNVLVHAIRRGELAEVEATSEPPR